MIRNPNPQDIENLKKLHQEYFSNEFTFEEFLHASISMFVVTDDVDDQIITAGSIRPIAEMVAITNLSKSPRLRRDALYEMLQVASYVLKRTQMTQLHAFVQSNSWEVQLIKSGFHRTKGNALYINIEKEEKNGERR